MIAKVSYRALSGSAGVVFYNTGKFALRGICDATGGGTMTIQGITTVDHASFSAMVSSLPAGASPAAGTGDPFRSISGAANEYTNPHDYSGGTGYSGAGNDATKNAVLHQFAYPDFRTGTSGNVLNIRRAPIGPSAGPRRLPATSTARRSSRPDDEH